MQENINFLAFQITHFYLLASLLNAPSLIIPTCPRQSMSDLPSITPASNAPVQVDPLPAIPSQASTDEQVLRMWLHGKSEGTRRGYLRDIGEFFERLAYIYKVYPDRVPLQRVKLDDLQRYSLELEDRLSEQTGEPLSRATRARKLAAIKSLLTFAYDIGYIRFNPGKAVRQPKVRRRLAQRILTESEVHRLLSVYDGRTVLSLRNRVMLRLCYASSGRVSEISHLKWEDVAPREVPGRGTCGQINLFGKGEKERAVLVSPETWEEILELRRRLLAKGKAEEKDPVFPSRKRDSETGRPGHLDPSQVWRVVKKAAKKAGLKKAASPHWLRHAHVSHALDRGAPVHQVRETAGHQSLTTTTDYSHAKPGDSSGLYLPI